MGGSIERCKLTRRRVEGEEASASPGNDENKDEEPGGFLLGRG
jgi:hypothetical protein